MIGGEVPHRVMDRRNEFGDGFDLIRNYETMKVERKSGDIRLSGGRHRRTVE